MGEETRQQVFWEESHRRVVAPLLDRLAAKHVAALVMKGTALAYSVYADPAMRRRGDTDLLVSAADLKPARQALLAQGFSYSGERATGQENWLYETAHGFTHVIDLHWEAVGPPALRPLMEVGECFARSVPLPRLSATARMLDPVLLFLRGAINQYTHSYRGYLVEGDRLFEDSRIIWQLDSHLLAAQFVAGEWEELVTFAVDRGLGRPVLEQLCGAQDNFGTIVPPGVLERLEAAGPDGPLSRYLGGSSNLARFGADLRATRSLGDAARFVAGQAFPSDRILRDRYPALSGWPLSLLYLRRLAEWPFNALRKGHS